MIRLATAAGRSSYDSKKKNAAYRCSVVISHISVFLLLFAFANSEAKSMDHLSSKRHRRCNQECRTKTWASDKDAFNHGHGADLAQWWLQISGSIWSNMLSIWNTWGPSYGCFLKWWENPHFTPQVRIIFSRKTMENQWLLGTAILGTPRIWFFW